MYESMGQGYRGRHSLVSLIDGCISLEISGFRIGTVLTELQNRSIYILYSRTISTGSRNSMMLLSRPLGPTYSRGRHILLEVLMQPPTDI